MKQIVAKIISFLFHPLLIPTYAMILLLWSGFPYGYYLSLSTKLLLLQYTLAGTFIFPLIIILVMYFRKTISSITLERQEEKFLPYANSIIFFALLIFLFQKTNLGTEIKIIPILAFSVGLSLLIINFRMNICAHTAGIGSLTGFLLSLSIRYNLVMILSILAVIIISGFVCYSQLKLKMHNSREVYFGYLLGFLLSISICSIAL